MKKFGNVWVDPHKVQAASISYKKVNKKIEDGLVIPVDSDVAYKVVVFLSGNQVTLTDSAAREFVAWLEQESV